MSASIRNIHKSPPCYLTSSNVLPLQRFFRSIMADPQSHQGIPKCIATRTVVRMLKFVPFKSPFHTRAYSRGPRIDFEKNTKSEKLWQNLHYEQYTRQHWPVPSRLQSVFTCSCPLLSTIVAVAPACVFLWAWKADLAPTLAVRTTWSASGVLLRARAHSGGTSC
ncbi:hypothetical protein BaRGS_00027769 [Batillaria attramentaria]|uniref:Uncharacterized protein n=1 Tax=Batillaria attramentaria TaxID=370345 RepID=A0ABD0K195_9CAEN